MSLLQEWRNTAYEKERNDKEEQLFWGNYFAVEKGIYEQLLAAPEVITEGTVTELAAKYNTTISIMTGFIDGINDSLITSNPIDELTEDTIVHLNFDNEKLYYNMVGANAEWLYNLPAWDNILTETKKKELYLQQKKSNTIVNDGKIGRNDPCPCGSGKKFKFCCGK